MLPFAIRFKLRDVRDIPPWGDVGAKQLHWFGLTDGCYCIDTSEGRLFEHAGAAPSDLGVAWCDYYVSRVFEDIIEIWPSVSDPVPPDVLDYFYEWSRKRFSSSCIANDASLSCIIDHFFKYHWDLMEDGSDDNSRLDLISGANSWWWDRRLHTSYLHAMVSAQLWRTGSELTLEWRADDPWLPARAQLTMPFGAVDQAVRTFCRDFLQAMRDRVSEIARDGWKGQECDLNIEGLASEQVKREASAAANLSALRPTDWEAVRASLHELSSLPG